MRYKNLVGEKVGKITVIEYAGPDDHGRALWKCKCECGTVFVRQSSTIVKSIKNNLKSHCGCSPSLKTHGLSQSNKKLFWVWAAMIQRCHNEKNKDFYAYGARGIAVCDQWRHTFEHFCIWALSNGYDETLTIDRKDNNGNYDESNCRFVPLIVQMNNQRKTRKFEWRGVIYSLSELSEISGFKRNTLRQRLLINNWDIDKAMTTQPKRGRNAYY